MAVRIATPFSHLFADPSALRAIVAASDMVELRLPGQAGEVGGDVLFHCEYSLAAPWGEAEAAQLRDLTRLAGDRLRLASFHLLSRYAENTVVDGAFAGVGEPMARGELLAHVQDNVRVVRELLGPDAPLLVENNNHLGTDAYDLVTDPAFITEVMDLTGAGLLLDVAHARITARNTGVDEADYLAALPLDRVVQVHLSGHGEEGGGRRFDAHGSLKEEDFAYFTALAPSLPGMEYVTIEYYRDADVLLRQLERLRSALRELA